ncbi:hypothetical protein JXO59_14520 [candidate division KSB1 bacterium]|nr:hypothetical protein [candidate division KSB1 bacterium]
MSDNTITVEGIVIQGHGVASQKSEHYPDGTIILQLPYFKQLGLDLTPYFRGTLNITIRPHQFFMKNPQYHFKKVEWTQAHPPEDFSFSKCGVIFKDKKYQGWIYYPHPETKKRHFKDDSIIEVIAMFIPDIGYGDKVLLELDAREVGIR